MEGEPEGSSSYVLGGGVDELHQFDWYHGDISAHAAEALLILNGQDGSYLLRRDQDVPKQFVLEVRSKDSVKHFQVKRLETGYIFGLYTFLTLQEFRNHFADQPLIGNLAGSPVLLKSPYPREVPEPLFFDPVTVHLTLKSGCSGTELVAEAPALGTKEGFLLILSKLLKTWNTRWVTIQRYELKYYKEKQDRDPLGIINLSQCTDIQFDYSQGKVNSFCLVFPEQTHYLGGKSAQETDEWIKLIRWKLKKKQRRSCSVSQSS
ncbi:dual adapter for phosphotyrosine and 3-phosphotyrosine and 3-phosphoinositide isoform X2 [Callorhinchus milii]|uniref:dual adapter for phosphotyrosine and 3-phosphotyrosine and 3-phosphoinositide isoform X2 n=1 Tax=Callorhinchus milii TaxID=7868 RepID=UPI0004573CE5|nr:dual adapter for phosphotyrosine and 3-phosphotyrosine and 3-phosphoinositide isoform X2 [Callorhinchus milii]|eukprot:gi/632977875/ref/XP_007905591.1/ PREDICTED: dual adapter for phosphotyrosine and 3-phosphotyrosine and 3-phosphoinositide-like isoform X2 [Callorhinchus milii]